MKVDYLIMNEEQEIFFPTIVKNTGSRNTNQDKYYKNK